MKVKFNEIGHSMLEMLGVLAVTGVLSVGGIMGYRFAMDKYRANETLNELQIRVADLSRQMLNGIIELSVDEMGDRTRMGYPIRARISPQYADYFEVFLDEVPSGVCRQLLKSQWTIPYSIFVGTTEYEIDASICNEAETVTLAYEFKDDLTEKKFIEEEERHETWRCYRDNDCKCATCEQGLCKTMCPENSGCAKSYDNPNSWMCCLKDSIVSGLCCTSIGENGECCNSNNKCCPKDKPLRDKDGNCYACDDEKQVNIEGTIENCAVCSNRLVSGSKKYCVLKCGLKGTSNENKPLMDTDGKCYTCNTATGVNVKGVENSAEKACPKRYIVGTWGSSSWSALCGVAGTTVADKPLARYDGQCYACNYNKGVYQEAIYSQYKCLSVCKNERSAGSVNHCYPKCPKLEGEEPKPIIDVNGTCHDCYYNQPVSPDAINGECSTVCPNRKMENGYCVLKDCPTGKPLKDKDGKCYSCEEEAGVNVKGVEEEAKKACPKRYIVGTWGSSSWSALCGVAGTTVADKPLARYDGQCYACNYNKGVYQEAIYSQYKCLSVCKNERSAGSVNHCYPKCPKLEGEEPKPIIDTNGTCHDCYYNQAVSPDAINGECSTVCPNRKMENGYCVLKDCPAGKPLKNKDGKCYSCEEEAGVNVKGVEEEAKKACPKRYIVGTWGSSSWSALCGVAGTTVADKPLARYDGQCFACNYNESVYQEAIYSTYRCSNICGNRSLNVNSCIRDYCSETAPMEDKNGICHPCNEPLPIDVGGDETKCSCLNRTLDGQYCVLNGSSI